MQIKLKQYDDYQIVSKNLKLTIAQGVLLLFNVSMRHSFHTGPYKIIPIVLAMRYVSIFLFKYFESHLTF